MIQKLLFFLLIIAGVSFAQFTDFHPELQWYTIKGKHVEVHFHEGAERTARVVCKIADEVWGPITSLYDYEPETVHFVIKDLDDYSNGATYFFDNKIEIWASALDFDLRGEHNWLRNVISHEFTHMVEIQSSMKAVRTLPAVFFQVLNYEAERRPDILYGYPNFIVSYPLAMLNMPAWFAEGTAQNMRPDFDYDQWDTHRDMILRSYALENTMLSWNEMGEFGKTSLGNESVYNAGFALTRYISQKYGENKLKEISRALGKFGNFTIDAAFKDALGKDGIEIYDEWKNYVTESYKNRSAAVESNTITGTKIANEGFGNFYPIFSQDGKKVLYISNKTSDYFSPSGIYLYDLETKKEKEITAGVRSTFTWIPGTNKIVYAKISDDNPNWYNVHDLYVYDIDTEKETRLTFNTRANQPSVSRDGKKITYIFQKDGTTNLGICDIDGKNFKQLTAFGNGEQIYNPSFSNDNSYIVFDYSYHQTRDIAAINADGSNYHFVVQTKNDERNPVIDQNGNLIYSSDETGIFNLYSLNLNTNERKQLTNVLGGAFMPNVNSNGDITYSGYTSKGFKIYYLPKNEQSLVDTSKKYSWVNNPPLGESNPKGDLANFDINRLRNFNDYETPDYKKEKYTGEFTKLTFFPLIRYDNYNTTNNVVDKIKPGLYVSSNDMLNRYSIFAGADINDRLERDLFLIFEYKNKLPLLFDLGLKPELSLELYNISRKANQNVTIGGDTTQSGNVNYDYVIPTDITYNLFEVDLAASHRIFSRNQNIELRYIFSRYSALIGSFVIQTPTQAQLSPAFDDTYLISSNFQVKYNFDLLLPYRDAEINPVGTQVEIKYNYEMNQFNNTGNYSVDDQGNLVADFNHFYFHRLELNLKSHLRLWGDHTLTAQVRLGNIFGPTVPDFFNFYLGGLIGMKAYPFYSISGNKLAWLNLTYRFPLFRDIDSRIGHLYVDKIYMSFYGDLGDAAYADKPKLSDFKRGVGTELRMEMSSFYLFPTMVFLNASYGFDKVTLNIRGTDFTYGQEWRFYGGVLFSFDF
jgi:Tol biopolymer transport system component